MWVLAGVGVLQYTISVSIGIHHSPATIRSVAASVSPSAACSIELEQWHWWLHDTSNMICVQKHGYKLVRIKGSSASVSSSSWAIRKLWRSQKTLPLSMCTSGTPICCHRTVSESSGPESLVVFIQWPSRSYHPILANTCYYINLTVPLTHFCGW